MLVLSLPAILMVLPFLSYESLGQIWFLAAFVGVCFTRFDLSQAGPPLIGFLAVLIIAYLLRFAFTAVGTTFNFYDLSFMLLSTGLFFSCLFGLSAVSLPNRVRSLVLPFSQWLANISYSLYLTHLTVFAVFMAYIGIDTYAKLGAACGISILVAHIFYVLFDARHRDVRRWLKSVKARVTDHVTGDRKVLSTVGTAAAASVIVAVMAYSVVEIRSTRTIELSGAAHEQSQMFLRTTDASAGDYLYFGAENREPDRAAQMWRTAADAGSARAKLMLAVYAPEMLTAEEDEEALLVAGSENGLAAATLRLIERAPASSGSEAEVERLRGTAYLQALALNTSSDPIKQERGAQVLAELASQGHVDSMVLYGDAIRGQRMRDPMPMSVAVVYWQRASDLGSALGAYLLGETYSTGSDDVGQNRQLAGMYYRLADQRGYPGAAEKLKKLLD